MFHSTKTLVTEIPARAMLDLEEIGGEGLRDEYAVLASLDETEGGLMLLAEHAGSLIAFKIQHDTHIPVITYVSNALEAQPSRRSS
jgi:hypothetical protein